MIVLAFVLFLPAQQLLSQQLIGQQQFDKYCEGCHGADARGTAKGPGLTLNPRVAEQSPEQLTSYLERGNVAAGMPSFADLPVDDRAVLARYLRRLNVETIVGPVTAMVPARKITWGPPQPGDWLTYNGNDSANRYSPLKQINTANVSSLKLKWVFPIPHFGLEMTPLAADGVLYITGPNQVFAVDALTGDALWHYSRPASTGMLGDARLGTNRGVAILRERVFFVTDNAHLLALTKAFEASSPLSSPKTALSFGGIGPCLGAASPVLRPGKGKSRSPVVVLLGSPVLTTRHQIPSTGLPAIHGLVPMAPAAPATIFTPTAFLPLMRKPERSNGTTNSHHTI